MVFCLAFICIREDNLFTSLVLAITESLILIRVCCLAISSAFSLASDIRCLYSGLFIIREYFLLFGSSCNSSRIASISDITASSPAFFTKSSTSLRSAELSFITRSITSFTACWNTSLLYICLRFSSVSFACSLFSCNEFVVL